MGLRKLAILGAGGLGSCPESAYYTPCSLVHDVYMVQMTCSLIVVNRAAQSAAMTTLHCMYDVGLRFGNVSCRSVAPDCTAVKG
jgi:hypothetical protein